MSKRTGSPTGRPKKYPLVVIRECVMCKRIYARYISDGQQNTRKDYCGPMCMKEYKSRSTGDARKAAVEKFKKEREAGRKSLDSIPGPGSWEEKSWRGKNR